jgi:hypothetical protein
MELPIILSPTCPRCGGDADPLLPAVSGFTQAVCVNDACDVFMWNPTESAATFEAKAQRIEVEEVVDEHGQERTIWRPGPSTTT